jgi:hypothetical protein
VRVQAKERCRHGHFFVVIAPERRVPFFYSSRHDSEAVDAMPKGERSVSLSLARRKTRTTRSASLLDPPRAEP